MREPIYGHDADGVVHYWYPGHQHRSLTIGCSGCGLKDHNDFVSLSYVVEGGVTCIGCLATVGDESEMQGLLGTLHRSMEAVLHRKAVP